MEGTVHLNGLKGWSVWSVPVVSGLAGDPTSLARNTIYLKDIKRHDIVTCHLQGAPRVIRWLEDMWMANKWVLEQITVITSKTCE